MTIKTLFFSCYLFFSIGIKYAIFLGFPLLLWISQHKVCFLNNVILSWYKFSHPSTAVQCDTKLYFGLNKFGGVDQVNTIYLIISVLVVRR